MVYVPAILQPVIQKIRGPDAPGTTEDSASCLLSVLLMSIDRASFEKRVILVICGRPSSDDAGLLLKKKAPLGPVACCDGTAGSF
jgi:hypothetical protein